MLKRPLFASITLNGTLSCKRSAPMMSEHVKLVRQSFCPNVPDRIRAELMDPLPVRRYRDDLGVWQASTCKPEKRESAAIVTPIDFVRGSATGYLMP